jgi:hypothetical protein
MEEAHSFGSLRQCSHLDVYLGLVGLVRHGHGPEEAAEIPGLVVDAGPHVSAVDVPLDGDAPADDLVWVLGVSGVRVASSHEARAGQAGSAG